MNNRYPSLFLLMFSLLFLHVYQASAAEGLIENVEYGNNEGKFESVAFHLNGAYLPKVFAMKGERPRVVFDFYETTLHKRVPASIQANGKVVKQVRMGRHTDKTRVVIDLHSMEGYHFDQKFDEEKNILTILLFSDSVVTQVAAVQESPAQSTAEPVIPPSPSVVSKPLTVDTIPAKEEVFPTPVTAGKTAAVASKSAEVIAEKLVPPVEEELALTPVVESVAAVENEVVEESNDIEEEAAVSLDPLLTDVSFENTSNNGEMVLFKLNGFFPPTVTGEESGTPRVVCKFSGTRLSDKVVKDQKSNGAFVERIRVTQSASGNQLDVILDLVPNKNYDLQQVFFKEDNLFVVIVNTYDAKNAETVTHPSAE